MSQTRNVDEGIELEFGPDPLPRRPDSLPDYFCYPPSRMVSTGSLLATVHPPCNDTLARGPFLTAGTGVCCSEDGCRFYAARDGFVELQGNCLSVHALRRIETDIACRDEEYPGGVILLGSLTGSRLQARGVVAVQGRIAGGSIRSRSDVFVHRAARARIVADGHVYVLGMLHHCQVITRGRIVALDGASLVGGKLVAAEGIEAACLGAPDDTETQVCVGGDHFTRLRLAEVEEEITACELNVQKIGQALRPLLALSAGPLPAKKRSLMQMLTEQRRSLESRVSDLHVEKRTLLMMAKSPSKAEVTAVGTVYPGVCVTIRHIKTRVGHPQQGVVFAESEDGRTVIARPRP